MTITRNDTDGQHTSTSSLLNVRSTEQPPKDLTQVSGSTSSDQQPRPTAREWHIYQQGINAGYKSGYKHGFQDAVYECDEADREAQDAFTRAASKSAQQAIDTNAAREKLRNGELR